ncbi:MAG TPA: hypothetical protein VE954_16485 [Oligoflexus sp.]|uniref:hypothetical protein n=1 Tax=Oligoflexus sp. TaxID=1971216 RepID=UPI002D668B6A|nr:hypothetical protein [Oligoflexus sp.]HYX34696.1 hypothetical protein [Oligoflexus sp.]
MIVHNWKLGVLLIGALAGWKAEAAQLRDIGVIGLMSHDIFSWDNKKNENTENGRLDLSTIFDYGTGKSWEAGGNPKNCENAPVCTITMSLVGHYQEKLKTETADEARRSTVVLFQTWVKESYVRLSGLDLPTEARDEPANNVEQAALRAMHDILPGKVQLFNRPLLKDLDLTNVLFAKLQLNEDELNQEIAPFDGDYDLEYKAIKIPFSNVVVNLKEVDRKFIETYSTYKQADMLAELRSAGLGEIKVQDVFFMHHISDLVAKAFCSKDNAWMPSDLPCL